MDFLFFREPTVPNLEGELVAEEGDSDSDDGNACWTVLAGVGALGAGLTTGVEGDGVTAAVDAAPFADGFSGCAAGVTGGSVGTVSLGSGAVSETGAATEEAAGSVEVGSVGSGAGTASIVALGAEGASTAAGVTTTGVASGVGMTAGRGACVDGVSTGSDVGGAAVANWAATSDTCTCGRLGGRRVVLLSVHRHDFHRYHGRDWRRI